MRYFHKQPPEGFCKKDAIKDFVNFTWKHLCWSLFSIKLQTWSPATLLKRNSNTGTVLWTKFLIVPVPKNICERLLLHIWNPNYKYCNLHNLHNSWKHFILEFIRYFLTSSTLQTLVPPDLYLLLRLSRLLNISNVLHSNSLNRLNALSPDQKFLPLDNVWVQDLFSKAV